MDARLYLTLAQRLIQEAQDGHHPAECRSATSRAYYAVFNVAVKFIDGIGSRATNSGGAIHDGVQIVLAQSGDERLVEASHILDDLREERSAADYKLNNRSS